MGSLEAASNLSIRKSLAEGTDLKPTGYWHPFTNSHAQCDSRYPCASNSNILIPKVELI